MVVALIVAAGSSVRMGENKLLINLFGKTVIEHTLSAFDNNHFVDKIVVVFGDPLVKEIAKRTVNKPLEFAKGGKLRSDSVKNGLAFVNDEDIVLIHDGARPFVCDKIINDCIDSVKAYGNGICALPVYDSLRKVDGDDFVEVDRNGVFAMQTPQGFSGELIKIAHSKRKTDATDDAILLKEMGEKIRIVMGDKNNIKLTTKADLPKTNKVVCPLIKVGQGLDVHALVKDRDLILCGVKIPFELGLLGHSDADVALHALMDGILGALGLGDIGTHFSDTDMKFKDISSMVLLEDVVQMMREKHFELVNCDLTIVAQKPKLLPFIASMKKNVAMALGTDESNVNIKATTTEKLGFEGRMEGISANCVVLLREELS